MIFNRHGRGEIEMRHSDNSCVRAAILGTALAVAIVAIGAVPALAADEPTVTLMTHDSFYLPDAVIESFEAEHGARVELLPAGDAGAMVNQAILTADRPLADVLYGIDNTFLSRALDAGIFEPYSSPALAAVADELVLDPAHRVTPIDRADVCLNLDRAGFSDGELPRPGQLEDLLDPALHGTLVVENPATSSPGLAFLLATVAHFGEDPETGWQAFWRGLRENDVSISAGWEEAYYGSFSGGSGEGDRPIVVSYASSPAAEVVFGPDPEADESPTLALDVACFRQIEFAGILRGTDEPELAGALIDHLLAPETQAELPLAMYVYPVRDRVELPDAFKRHAIAPMASLEMEPAAIDAGRERWIAEWTDIVLR
jgi:thiamine transport system substrate-binding protein